MAKLKMMIPNEKNPRAYLPRELIDEGFSGEVEILANAFTATIVKPKSTLEQIEKSLNIVLQDVRLRMGK